MVGTFCALQNGGSWGLIYCKPTRILGVVWGHRYPVCDYTELLTPMPLWKGGAVATDCTVGHGMLSWQLNCGTVLCSMDSLAKAEQQRAMEPKG